MKKLPAVILFLLACGAAWFFLLRPEQISQETLTADFEMHQQAYQDIASYLTDRNISTKIDNIPIAGEKYEGVSYEDSDEYAAFMEAIYVVMEQDHDEIVSNGNTVEFIFHSTGGKLNAKSGSVIYTTADSVPAKETQKMKAAGWFLYLAEK